MKSLKLISVALMYMISLCFISRADESKKCFAPVVCSMEGKSLTEWMQIFPNPECQWEKAGSLNKSLVEEIQQLKNVQASYKKQLQSNGKAIQVLKRRLQAVADSSSQAKINNTKLKSTISTLSSKVAKLEKSQAYQDRKLQTLLVQLAKLKGWRTAPNGLLYEIFHETGNYSTAKAKCHNKGATLAYTGLGNATVFSFLQNLARALSSGAWIGLNDIVEEGKYTYEDGSVANISELSWSTNEPDDSDGNSDCVHIWAGSGYGLDDASCASSETAFICQKNQL